VQIAWWRQDLLDVFFVIIEAMSRFSELKHAASGMVVK
jgi:hypothetical protein